MAASVGYFIEYIMMHGTINIKYLVHNFVGYVSAGVALQTKVKCKFTHKLLQLYGLQRYKHLNSHLFNIFLISLIFLKIRKH